MPVLTQTYRNQFLHQREWLVIQGCHLPSVRHHLGIFTFVEGLLLHQSKLLQDSLECLLEMYISHFLPPTSSYLPIYLTSSMDWWLDLYLLRNLTLRNKEAPAHTVPKSFASSNACAESSGGRPCYYKRDCPSFTHA